MPNTIAKSYNTIYELPSQVRTSFDERDQEKWLELYNQNLKENPDEKDIEDAKVKAWMGMVDAPSSLAVETWGSVEVRDADGELVPIDTITEHAENFIKAGGLLHDSHSNVPVGTVWDYEVRKHPETGQDGIVFYFNIYRDGEVFERARDDILSGRKNAVSIGAEAPRGGYKCDDRGCYVERDVTDLYELSICETPANPEAYFINVGKDIAKAKTPIEGEVFRIGIKDVVVHQDYTTCPLQKCKHDLIEQGFSDVHINDDGKIIAKSKDKEFNLFKAIKSMDYPFRYDLKKEQFEIMPDYGVEQAIEEAVGNGWAHEDQVGHVCLTKEIPKEVFMDWYDRGFICKVGDFYCLKGDDVAKNELIKSFASEHWTEQEREAINSLIDGIRDISRNHLGALSGFGDEIEELSKFAFSSPIYIREKFFETVMVHWNAFTHGMYEMNQWLSGDGVINDYIASTKKKVKKDGGAMGVGDAGATNPVYGAKPTSLVTPTGDKKYGRKKKTKKEFTDDGNIHAVGSRQAKDMKKGHGNYFDAIENFIVDSPEGVFYNDILDEFSDSLNEDDILDALEQICNDGGIVYNDNTERFVVAKKVKKSK